jgi:hypothetical protein
MRLLKVVEINKNNETDEPVNYVCYHPIAEKRLLNGEYSKPTCCAVDYEYQSILEPILESLGWQGGTLNQAIEEIKRLRQVAK